MRGPSAPISHRISRARVAQGVESSLKLATPWSPGGKRTTSLGAFCTYRKLRPALQVGGD